MAKGRKTSEYDVHPGVAMMVDWIATLKSKTGRTLDGWLTEVKRNGPKETPKRRDWLKSKYGFGTNAAWWIAERADPATRAETIDDDPESYLRTAGIYVKEMYAGPKAGLKPIHDALIKLGRSLGKDVRVCPCKTIVPLYREHVFAQIKPSTRTRIDLGLALTHYKGKLPARLIDTGGLAKKDRITHRIEISSLKDIDADVKKWLKIAYGLDVKRPKK
jgi:hypothetical protein